MRLEVGSAFVAILILPGSVSAVTSVLFSGKAGASMRPNAGRIA